ncbi:MAG: LPXTG cell wall anchor domain-containing protein [Rothia sp. (in: high G+C Gram-positive bacteria)]|uniref:LPXTG cell wall anchor domain-containing protein n=1 Tax=Rothia sp. (in: high G+C Gram-positive bacteria) TaxID=1885016 RepID=UPI0026E08AF7|nr:LPXTG cell wall anchor domain-containing protein [Rothia sp. (in: high G+C Gram-positive bacteria)]MDO5750945.1 LPXTG cell wall anchor domain-containing protein [Rothia sp. (in: high G+C Gram-positive bacteria)]
MITSGKAFKSLAIGALALSLSGVATVPATFAADATAPAASTTVRNLDASATKAKITQGLPGQFQVSYSAKNHKVWIAGTSNNQASTIARADANSLKIEAVAALPTNTVDGVSSFAAAYGIYVDDASNTVWVTNTRDNTVAAYDQDTMEIVWSTLGAKEGDSNWIEHPREVLVDNASGKVFVTGRFYISAIDPKNNTVEKIQLEGAPDGGTRYISMNIFVQDGKLYVPERTGGKLFIIDTKTFKVEKTIQVHADTEGTEVRPSDVAVDKSLNEIYVSSQGVKGVNSGVTVYDATTGAYKASIPFGTQALSLVHDEDRDLVYVTDFGTGKVGVFDGRSDKLIGEVAMNGAKANDLVLDKNGAIIAVDKVDLEGAAAVPYVLDYKTNSISTSSTVTLPPSKDRQGNDVPEKQVELHANSILKFKAEVKESSTGTVENTQITPKRVEFQGYPEDATDTVVFHPQLSFEETSFTKGEAMTIKVSGKNYLGEGAEHGVYVFILPKGAWEPGQEMTPELLKTVQGAAAITWVKAEQIKDGEFSTTLEIPAEKSLADGEYIIGTMAAHRLALTDRSMDAAAIAQVVAKDKATPTPSADASASATPSASASASASAEASASASQSAAVVKDNTKGSNDKNGFTVSQSNDGKKTTTEAKTTSSNGSTATTSTSNGTKLASTGADVALYAGIGALALLAGAALVVARRRKA